LSQKLSHPKCLNDNIFKCSTLSVKRIDGIYLNKVNNDK